jgi:hypothetical protein
MQSFNSPRIPWTGKNLGMFLPLLSAPVRPSLSIPTVAWTWCYRWIIYVTLPTCVACLGLGCMLPYQVYFLERYHVSLRLYLRMWPVPVQELLSLGFSYSQGEMNVTLGGRRWQDNHATMSVKLHLRMWTCTGTGIAAIRFQFWALLQCSSF